MGSVRYRAGVVTIGYTLLLVFTTAAAFASEQTYGSIHGTVANSVTGEPLRKAYVRLVPVRNSDKVRPAVTDAEGRFVFEKIEPGSYSLEAERAGFIESKYGEDGGRAVELKIAPGQDLAELKIRLSPPAAISGRIRDEDGEPWTHAHISIYRSVWEKGHRQLQGFDNAEVNEAGEFRAEHLRPGRYYVAATPDDNWEKRNRPPSTPRLQQVWYPGSLDSTGATPVVLRAGQEITGVEIQLRLNRTYRIRGTVSGLKAIPALPGPGMFMAPRLDAVPSPGNGGNSRSGHMKQDGSFEVDGLTPGTWQLRVEEGFLNEVVPLGEVTVLIGNHDVDGVVVPAHAPHLLKGVLRLEGENSVLPEDLQLLLLSATSHGWDKAGKVHADGGFEIENVPSGRHRVSVHGLAEGAFYVKRVRYRGLDQGDDEISVADDGGDLEVTLSASGARVKGVVRRSDETGSLTAQVVLMPETKDPEAQRNGTHLAVLDQAGSFAIPGGIRPGKYTLYAFEGVPEGAWTDAEFMKEMEGKGTPVEVAEGDVKALAVPLITRAGIAALLIRLGID